MPLEATGPAQATTADLTARARIRSAAPAQFTERGRRRQNHPRCGSGRMGCPRVSQAALDIISPALADDGLADGRPASLASMEAVPCRSRRARAGDLRTAFGHAAVSQNAQRRQELRLPPNTGWEPTCGIGPKPFRTHG
jgi:hypothetical protein